MKRITLLMLSVFTALTVCAQQTQPAQTQAVQQNPMISFTTDEKVIYVNELGLPPTSSLLEALRIVPELVTNDFETLLTIFDVQIDDVPVGDAKSSVLLHTHISEVAKVEITTNPTSAQNSSGITGVINIIMKPAPDGVTGNANLEVASNFMLMPSASVNYHKDGLSVLSSIYLQYSNFTSKETDLYQTERTTNNFKNEAAKLYIKNDFNPYDHLTFWLLQSVDKSTISSELNKIQTVNDSIYKSGTQITTSPALLSNINVMMKYEKTTDRAGEKMLASLSYSNKYNDDCSEVTNSGSLYNDAICSSYSNQYISRPNNINSAFYYRVHLLSDTCAHQLRIKPGMNLNATINSGSSTSIYAYTGQGGNSRQLYDDFTRKVSFAPYLHFDYAWGPLAACITARYQISALFSRGETTDWQENLFHDFLGDFSLTYQPVEGHQLRFSTSRTTSSPSNVQLYNGPYYTNYDRMWHVGDSSLQPSYFDNALIQYVYHFKNELHEVQLSSAVEYILVENPIVTVDKTYDKLHLNYQTYETLPNQHVINANAAVYWRYRIFSLAFCTTIYDRISTEQSRKNELFYNFQLTTVLRFERNWTLSAQMLWLMPQSDFSILASISKAWGPWSARLTFDNRSNTNVLAGFSYVF